jgi:hypothetical protein
VLSGIRLNTPPRPETISPGICPACYKREHMPALGHLAMESTAPRTATMASTKIPHTMRSLAVRQYSKPSGYEVLQLPVPTIERPGDILIRVHAASIQTGDTQVAAGMSRLFAPLQSVSIPSIPTSSPN